MPIIRMWSGPRNLSTALMRSWENRPDTAVLDEPLYAYYLAHTGIDHPGADRIIEAGQTDLPDVIGTCQSPILTDGQTISYQKHMAHHLLPDTDLGWIGGATNVLLLRHPRRVIASYARVRASPTLRDLGYPQLMGLRDLLGPVLVVDADRFLDSPESHLRQLCEHASVPFDDSMLAWPAGPRDSDGAWAPYWYRTVEASTGFAAPVADDPAGIDLPKTLERLAHEAIELYNVLQEA